MISNKCQFDFCVSAACESKVLRTASWQISSRKHLCRKCTSPMILCQINLMDTERTMLHDPERLTEAGGGGGTSPIEKSKDVKSWKSFSKCHGQVRVECLYANRTKTQPQQHRPGSDLEVPEISPISSEAKYQKENPKDFESSGLIPLQ